jgi:hypothetical protein
VSTSKKLIYRSFILVGNSLTLIGCAGLILGLLGLIPIEFFAMGLSSGTRIVGSVAITGCLLSAIGYGIVDYLDN